jgi:hypothetical protein
VSTPATALQADPRVGESVTVGTGKTVRLVPAPEGQGACRGPSRVGSRIGPASPEQSLSGSGRSQSVRSWPLLVLALPAAVAVWSGWVAIGRLTGFGEVHPLPGIWDSLHLSCFRVSSGGWCPADAGLRLIV